MQQNLSLGIPMRALFVIASGLLMLPQSAKADGNTHGLVFNTVTNTRQTVDDPFAARGTGNGAAIHGLSDEGRIVGFYVNAAGQTVALAGIQTSEPSSLTLLGIGAILVALGYKRRRDRARSKGYSISRFAQTDVSNAADPQIHERIGESLMR